MGWANKRVAVVFDNQIRPETTGIYCRRALAELVRDGLLAEVDHILPHELPRVIPGQFALIVFVDDGLDYAIPELGCPSVFWAIDTHLDLPRCLRKSRQATWTFSAQKLGVLQFAAAGIQHVAWLPLACDPLRHARENLPTIYDVSFVGNLFPGPRSELVEFIQTSYPRSFVGRKYFEEMARVYSASKCVFNRSLNNDLNMRVFEGLCSGALLVTDELIDNGLSDLFQSGTHLVTYQGREHLQQILGHFLTHEDERRQIAEAGRLEVLARHTYRHRMEEMLQKINRWSGASALSGRDSTTSERKVTDHLVLDHVSASGSPLPLKAPGYFDWSRPEILDLIPATAQSVLDIGCGAGRLGESLKSRQPTRVIGVELDSVAASFAATRLDEIKIGNIEDPLVEFKEGEFDCVICADILEHLRHPERLLDRIRDWLTPDGCLVVSVPNVRNHTVLRSLLAGNWTYESAGLLDEDHVRFFTRRELEKLLFRCGFSIPELRMVPGEGFESWIQQGRPRQLAIGGLQVRASSPEDATEFYAYQYLARSCPDQKRNWGLTSIILVTHNQWSFTQQCLDSIRMRTGEPYEVIVVDNGSTDGTVAALQTWDGVTVIANETNRGFPAAVNQGLSIARGQNLLLLNNDTIVTTGWLRRMLDALHSNPEIGLTGPLSNCVSGEQQIESAYSHLSELDGFAWDWGRDHSHELVETDRLVGFCLLIKRAVYQTVGTFDEQFGIGNFEDDDYCLRARRAGFKAVICRGAFVHHFGGTTFRATGVDFESLLESNRRKFVAKHEMPDVASVNPDSNCEVAESFADDDAGCDRVRSHYLAEIGTGNGLRLVPNGVRLSVCLIVRDNENTIRPCLESIRPWVDEIVVVDTGSKDRTATICEELGARLFHWEWRDDFAAARNVSLRHARGEWLFWMDSDDTISPECGRKLRALADGSHDPRVLGYVMQVHCPGEDANDVTVVDHVKMFRNLPELRFEFRIHEQILPAIRRAGGEVAFTDIHVTHSGADHTPAGKIRKLERDVRILNQELQDHPEHPFTLFNLGMTYADAGEPRRAAEFLKQSIAVAQPTESHLRKAYALLVSAHRQMNQPAEALLVCQTALQDFPEDRELNFLHGGLLHECGKLWEAERAYQRVIAPSESRYFASLDAGLAGYKVWQNLALVQEDLEAWNDAEISWKTAIDLLPTNRMAWRGLGELLLKQNRFDDLSVILQAISTAQPLLRSEAALLRAQMAMAEGDLPRALCECQMAENWEPASDDALRLRCRLLFENEHYGAAITSLRELTDRCPADASAWHNLGSACLCQDQFATAIDCFDRSLKLRPTSPETRRLKTHAESIIHATNRSSAAVLGL